MNAVCKLGRNGMANNVCIRKAFCVQPILLALPPALCVQMALLVVDL